MEHAAIIEVVFSALAKLGPELYVYIKSLVDGGATAEELAQKPIEFYMAFGGKQGRTASVLAAVEADLPDGGK